MRHGRGTEARSLQPPMPQLSRARWGPADIPSADLARFSAWRRRWLQPSPLSCPPMRARSARFLSIPASARVIGLIRFFSNPISFEGRPAGASPTVSRCAAISSLTPALNSLQRRHGEARGCTTTAHLRSCHDRRWWQNATMTVVQGVTLAIAMLGAALGIINTWIAVSNRRVRLKVRPMWTVGAGPNAGFSIEVTNLSTFPLTITEVGFLYGRGKSLAPARMVITQPMVVDGKGWPRRLEAREEVSVYFDLGSIPTGEPFRRAYTKTACGEVATGDSPALKQLRDMVASRR